MDEIPTGDRWLHALGATVLWVAVWLGVLAAGRFLAGSAPPKTDAILLEGAAFVAFAGGSIVLGLVGLLVSALVLRSSRRLWAFLLGAVLVGTGTALAGGAVTNLGGLLLDW